MTRKVFDNRQVAHVWASRSQDEGRSSNGQFYFTGNVLYSYGSHFPLGLIFEDANGQTSVLINASSYSVTTAKHRSFAWNAVHGRGWIKYTVANTDLMRRLVWCINRDPADFEQAWKEVQHYLMPEIARVAHEAEHATRKPSRDKWQRALAELLQSADSLARMCGKPEGQFSTEAIARHVEAVRLEEERKAQERAEAEARFKAECEAYRPQAEQIAEAWRNGRDIDAHELIPDWRIRDYLWGNTPTLVRKEGEEAVTSRGARVPWLAAVSLYTHALAVRKEGRDYVPASTKPRIGHFELRKIEANGNATVGCHYLTFEEMHKCAVREGVVSEEIAA